MFRFPTPVVPRRLLVAAINYHAYENREQDGWDFVHHCFTSLEIEQLLDEAGATSYDEAFAAVERRAAAMAVLRAELLAEL